MNKLKIEIITQASDDIDLVRALYIRSFPEKERRPFEELFDNDEVMVEMLAFYDECNFIGFACLLNSSIRISHIIYFAIEEDLRNKGYGSQILNAIHDKKAGNRMIVDIERRSKKADNNEQRQRRKHFYLRNGYVETKIKYRWEREDYEILVYGGNLSEYEFGRFWRSLEAKK